MRNSTTNRMLLRSASVVALAAGAWLGATNVAAAQAANSDTAPAAPATPAASDQSGAGAGSTVTVVATRRAEDVQKVPSAVVALGAAKLEQAGVQNFEDLAKMTPSLSIITNPGGLNFINIRGVGVGVSTPFQSAGVPLMVDGMYLPNSEYYLTNAYFDLSDVELYRGPQGTFAGQNSTGGAIFITSKQPDFGGFSGYVQQLVGNYGWYQTQAGVNLPINDQLAARFAINAETRDGWTHNHGALNPNAIGGAPTANNPGNLDNLDLRGIVRWRPNSNLDVRLRYDHLRDNSNGPADLNGSGAVLTAANPFTPPNNPSRVPSPRDVAYDYPGYSHFISDRVTLNVDWHINNDVELKDVTGYQHYNSNGAYDSDNGSPFTKLYGSTGAAAQSAGVVKSVDTYYYQEVDLLSTSASPLQWIAGGDYYWDSTPIHNEFLGYNTYPGNVTVGNPAACPTYAAIFPGGPVLGSTSACPGLGMLNYYQRDYSYAGFGEIRYNFSDQLQLIVGGRWTYYQINLLPSTNITDPAGHIVSWVPGPPAGLGIGYCGGGVPGAGAPFGPPAVAPALCSGVNGVAKYSRPSGRAVLNWFPNPGTTVYASVSYGFKQGSYVTQLDEGPGEHPGYAPETITDYELGLKTTTLDGHLRFNGNVFYEDYSDYQAAFFLSSAPIPLTKNINSAEIAGFEAQMDFVWDDLRLGLNAGYDYTRITKNTDLSLVPSGEYGLAGAIPASDNPFTCTVHPVGGAPSTGACENFVGKPLNFAPPWTVNFTAQYDFHVWGGTLTPWMQVSYQDAQWATLFHAGQDFLPAYTLVDFRLAYQAPEHWRLEGFVTNAFNKTYIAGVTGGTLGTPTALVLGAPQQYGVRIMYKW